MKRELLFLIGCIGSRLFLTYMAYKDPIPIAYIATVISFGFMYIYLNGLRKTGIETFGEPIWWDDLRPIHSILYGLYAYLAFSGYPDAWQVLLIDTLFGLTAWTLHQRQQS